MKRKSRHKRHVELLKKLVDKTDYFVGHVWNDFGISMHGQLDGRGRQRFVRYGDHCNLWRTPWLGRTDARHIYFAVTPKKNNKFGMVLCGWKELNWFAQQQIAYMESSNDGKKTV